MDRINLAPERTRSLRRYRERAEDLVLLIRVNLVFALSVGVLLVTLSFTPVLLFNDKALASSSRLATELNQLRESLRIKREHVTSAAERFTQINYEQRARSKVTSIGRAIASAIPKRVVLSRLAVKRDSVEILGVAETRGDLVEFVNGLIGKGIGAEPVIEKLAVSVIEDRTFHEFNLRVNLTLSDHTVKQGCGAQCRE